MAGILLLAVGGFLSFDCVRFLSGPGSGVAAFGTFVGTLSNVACRLSLLLTEKFYGSCYTSFFTYGVLVEDWRPLFTLLLILSRILPSGFFSDSFSVF